MPTWFHAGPNMGPCWLQKTVLARLGPFWRPLGPSCLEAGGGLGGAAPPSTARGLIQEASKGGLRRQVGASCWHVSRGGGFGGVLLDPLRGIQAQILGPQRYPPKRQEAEPRHSVLGVSRLPKNFAKTAQDASKMPPRQPKIRFSA